MVHVVQYVHEVQDVKYDNSLNGRQIVYRYRLVYLMILELLLKVQLIYILLAVSTLTLLAVVIAVMAGKKALPLEVAMKAEKRL